MHYALVYYALCTVLAPCTCTMHMHYALCTMHYALYLHPAHALGTMHYALYLHLALPAPSQPRIYAEWVEQRKEGTREGEGEEMSRRASYVQYKRGQKLVPRFIFHKHELFGNAGSPIGKYIHLKLSLAQMIKSTGTRPKCPHNSSSSTSNNSSNSSNGSNVLRELSSRLVLPPPLSTSYYSFLLLSARLALPRTARSIRANIQEVAATHRAKPRVPTPRRARTNVRRAW